MSTQINLSKFPCFDSPQRIGELNRLVSTQHDLMPHQVAVAVGCELEHAMTVLFFLYHRRLAEAFLLVYHKDHLDAPVLAPGLSAGFPSLPFTCDACGKEIVAPDELSYDLLFRLTEDIRFTVETSHAHL